MRGLSSIGRAPALQAGGQEFDPPRLHFLSSTPHSLDLKGLKMTQATLHTSKGDIIVELFPDHTPKTVANFVKLAKENFYNGTVFHRVIAGFMIQGGCPQGTGTGGPGYKFDDEFHGELQFDKPYLLAMANSGPNTNGSQFFITAAPTTWLNRKHSIFGEVKDAASQAVVDAIETTRTGAMDRPVEPITINSVTITE